MKQTGVSIFVLTKKKMQYVCSNLRKLEGKFLSYLQNIFLFSHNHLICLGIEVVSLICETRI